MLSRRLQQQDHHYTALETCGIGFLMLVVMIIILIILIRRSLVKVEARQPVFQGLGLQALQPTSDVELLPQPNGTSSASIIPNLSSAPEFRFMHKHKREIEAKVAQEKRIEILNIFEKHQVQRILQEQDFGELDVETGHAALGVISIRVSMGDEKNEDPSSKMKEETRTTTSNKIVGTACAICLDDYQVGEGIAWSCNAQCQHCFHQVCITNYLVYHRSNQVSSTSRENKNSKAPCPCCREDFLLCSLQP